MINYEALYNQAMAHNAMLREAAKTATDAFAVHYSNWNPLLMDEYGEIIAPVQETLNATGPDVEAWERKLREKVMLAVHPLQPEYEKLQQQLATVTAERDALRDFVDLIAIHKNDAYCSRDLSGLGFDAFYLLERLRQSPPSE